MFWFQLASPGPGGVGRSRRLSAATSALCLGVALTALLAVPGTARAESNNPLSVIFPFLAPSKPPVTQRSRPAAPQVRVRRLPDGSVYAPLGTSRRTSPRQRRGAGSFSGSYRTVCVRLCDGYYWPISYGVSSRNFRRDRNACEASCAMPAQLYVTSIGNDDTDRMRSLNGRRYSRLDNAYRYRRERVAQCGCRPEPWSEASKRRHALYARMERDGKRNRIASTGSDAPASVAVLRPTVDGGTTVRLQVPADNTEPLPDDAVAEDLAARRRAEELRWQLSQRQSAFRRAQIRQQSAQPAQRRRRRARPRRHGGWRVPIDRAGAEN